MVMAVVMVVPVPFPLKFYPCPSSWSQVRRIPGCIIYPIGLDAETDGFPEDFLWNATQFPHCHWLYHHVCMFLFRKPCLPPCRMVLYIISCSSMFPDVGVILAFLLLGWSLGFIWLHLAYGYMLVPGVYPMAHLSQLWCELCMCPSH